MVGKGCYMPIFIISPLGRESRLTLPRSVRIQGVQRPDHPTVDISRQIVIGFAQIPGKNGSKGLTSGQLDHARGIIQRRSDIYENPATEITILQTYNRFARMNLHAGYSGSIFCINPIKKVGPGM